MNRELDILILEDVATDAELVMRELRQRGIRFRASRVWTEADFLAALRNGAPDVILADYSLPSYDGLSALKHAGEVCPEVPFIFVSGSLGEETAVDALHHGATDYVLKQKLIRLGPAVERAVQEAALARERKQAEQQIRHLNDILTALQGINGLIVREKDREKLFNETCQILVQTRGYRLVWIGGLTPESKRVVPLAHAGPGSDYVNVVTVTWDDTPTGRGPVGTSIRTREIQVTQDTATAPRFAPWREAAIERGYASVAAVPLVHGDSLFGVLAVYADQPEAFDSEEIGLLKQLADDLAFALQSIEHERQRTQTDARLRASEARFRTLFEEATEGIGLADAETGEILDCNRALLQLTGYERDEMIGRPQAAFHPKAEVVSTVSRTFAEHRGGKAGAILPSDLVTKSGAIKHVEIKANVIELAGRRIAQAFFRDVTADVRYHHERETTLKLLRLLDDNNNTRELIRSLTGFLQEWIGCEAVGIRLREGDDFPYCETRGFPAKFVEAENFLCARDERGQPLRDSAGHPVLECMCGNILRGRFDPAKPFFTAKGSFWTNSTTDLLATTTEADRLARTRNRCNTEGYESLALFALRHGSETYGLLQINDSARGRFTPELINFLENAADQIAMALAQRQSQTALRVSQERYRLLADNSEDFVSLHDSQGNRLYLSPSYYRVTGWTPEDMKGMDWRKRVHPEDLAAVDRAWVANLAGEATRIERRTLCRDGSWLWVDARCRPVLGADGKVEHMVVWSRDITARKNAEANLHRLATAVDQAAEAIVITDAQASILYANPAFERITGYAREEAIGQNPRILKSGRHDAAFYRRMWDTLARGEVWTGRMTNKKKDGTLFEEEASISPVRDTTGQVVNYVAVKRDVTREVVLEIQLQQAQKMEAIGRLAGGVAHDFNNLLTVILNYAEMGRDDLPPDHPVRGYLDEIAGSARRSADLTRQLMAFARKQVIEPRVMDLNRAVAGMCSLLQQLIGEDVKLAWTPGAGLWSVKTDPSQIDQVLANFCINARDAIAAAGTISIETANVTLDEASCAGRPDFAPGRYVMLAVSDDGCGMDKNVIEHVFEPFFTTKPEGKGTGLGLATVYGIVRQNNGFIDVSSEPGKGTTFRIYLPQAAVVPGSAPRIEALGELPRGDETILLVEDEKSVQTISRLFLDGLGYRVLAAETPVDALALAKRHPGDIHLLLTDVILPGMNGRELAERIRAVKPGAKCLFMSGYTADVIAHRGVLEEGVSFVHKPFSRDDLARKIRETLQRKQGG